MTVTARATDVQGVALDAQAAALVTAISAAAAGSVELASLTQAQLLLNNQIFLRHLATGRLIANTIVNAALFGPHGNALIGSSNSVPSSDATTTALLSNCGPSGTLTVAIPARTSATWQTFNETQTRLLDQAQQQLLAVCLQRGYLTSATVLSSSL